MAWLGRAGRGWAWQGQAWHGQARQGKDIGAWRGAEWLGEAGHGRAGQGFGRGKDTWPSNDQAAASRLSRQVWRLAERVNPTVRLVQPLWAHANANIRGTRRIVSSRRF